MNLNQAVSFLKFHESQKAAQEREARAGRAEALDFERFALSQEQFQLSKEKFAFDFAKETQRMKEKEVEKEKGVITSLIGSYRQGNIAEKSAVVETMKSYYHTLDQHSKAKLDPFVQYGSPLSDMAIKGREFDATHPMPKAPTKEEFGENPRLAAQYMFDIEDRKWQREMVMTGHAPERKKLVMIDKDFGAFRGKDGVAQLLNNEDVALHLAASKTGISVVDFYTNNGVIREEEPTSYTVRGGQLVGVYKERDYLAKGDEQLKYATKRIGPATDTEVTVPPDIRELLDDVTFVNKKNPKAMAMREMLFQGEQERKTLIRRLQSQTKHISFKIDKIRELDWIQREISIPLRNMMYFWKWDRPKLHREAVEKAEGYGLKIIQGDEVDLEVNGYGFKKFYVVPEGTIRNGDNKPVGHTREQAAFLKRIEKEFDSIPSMLKTKTSVEGTW